MARLNYPRNWQIYNAASYQRKYVRESARRLDVLIGNTGPALCNYFVQGIIQLPWEYDQIALKTVAPKQLYTLSEAASPFANQGSSGGTAVLSAGAVSTAQTPAVPDLSAGIHSINNGYIQLQTVSNYASYDGPFTIEMWIYPTLISAITPLYSENNAGVTHFLQFFLDTDRRLGLQCNNGVTGFSVKDAAGPQVTLNTWNYVACRYASPNFTALTAVQGASSLAAAVAQNVTNIRTFTDTASVTMGFVGSSNGYIGLPATYNIAGAGQPTNENMVSRIAAASFSTRIVQIDSGTLAASTGVFSSGYGEGTAKPFPSMMVVGVSNNAGDTHGIWDVQIDRPD